MQISPLAGSPAPQNILVNIPKLVSAYYTGKPDPYVVAERVSFGTSGHRESSFKNSFNENHILAITQAICFYRKQKNIDGPLYMGFDTHALSAPAFATAMEVLTANDIETMIATNDEYTKEFGEPFYDRIEAKATWEQKEKLKNISSSEIKHKELAGEKIESIITNVPGNNASIGGIKVITDNGWFAARPFRYGRHL